MADDAFTIGQFFTMHGISAAALGMSELPQPGLYGRRATPQEVSQILRRKAFRDIFLVEKTLVEILWKFGNFNGINEISGRRRKMAFSWRWPTNF